MLWLADEPCIFFLSCRAGHDGSPMSSAQSFCTDVREDLNIPFDQGTSFCLGNLFPLCMASMLGAQFEAHS
jgi:hypothetical protein